MKQQTTQLQSKDNVNLHAQIWEPDLAPKAVVCLVHGHAEHVGRYEHVGAHFAAKGIALMGIDQRGHGKTKGKRGHAKYSQLMDDISLLIDKAKASYPGLPVFLYGHSMGGGEVLYYSIDRKPDIAGVISASPWLKLAFDPSKVDLFLANTMINIYPSFTQSTKLDAGGISRDEAEVKKYVADPLVHDKISPALFLGCHNSGLASIERAAEIKLPVLLMHGTADKVTSYEGSKEFAKKGGDNITFKTWEGLYHETHNEPEKEDVMQYITGWIQTQL